MIERFTLRELNLMAKTVPEKLKVELLFKHSYDEFVGIVERSVDWIAQEFARNPQLRNKRSEDELSIDIITALKAIGLDASHDATTGGHCDIVIQGQNDFLWLGESKTHTS